MKFKKFLLLFLKKTMVTVKRLLVFVKKVAVFVKRFVLKRPRVVAFVCVALLFWVLGVLFCPNVKVGVVSMPRVYQEAAVFQNIRQQQQSYEEKWRQEAMAQREALEKEDKDLSIQKRRLKKAAFDKKVAALKAKILDFQNTQMARLGMIRENVRHIMSEVEKQSEPLLRQIAQKRHLDLVLTDNNIVYASDRVDITNDLIERLNETLTQVDWDAFISRDE